MSEGVVKSVSEPIRVIASFDRGKINIHYFCWRERVYKVNKINLFHVAKDGNKKIYYFAVTAQGNSYEISYDPVDLDWYLEEVIGGR